MRNIINFEGMVNLCDAKGKVLAKMAKLFDVQHNRCGTSPIFDSFGNQNLKKRADYVIQF